MKVSPTWYNDAGELMAPRELDVKTADPIPGGTPTTDEGWYHRFKFTAATPAQRTRKREIFFARMANVPRCMILSINEYTVTIGSHVSYGVDVLYAVERPEGAAAPSDPYWWLHRYDGQ